jgi:hypothetical protein
LSYFLDWDHLEHAGDWILFEENISIDETYLSKGQLNTVLTNKATRGTKGTLVVMINGVDSDYVSEILEKIYAMKRDKIK